MYLKFWILDRTWKFNPLPEPLKFDKLKKLFPEESARVELDSDEVDDPKEDDIEEDKEVLICRFTI